VPEYLPEADGVVQKAKRNLKKERVPLEYLVVTQKLSRAVEEYKTPSPAARAAMQLQAAGRNVAPGQFIRFVYTRDALRVRAWDLYGEVDPRLLDTTRYCTLLDRSVDTVLEQHRPLPHRLF